MKAKPAFSLLVLLMLLIFSCREKEPSPMTIVQKRDIVKDQFPESQAEIKAVLNGIFKSIQEKDADKLISNHAYGAKFTEFRDSAPRTGSKGNEAYERGLVGAISSFDYDVKDLKINVFGEVAVVTFHADFRPTIEQNTSQINGQVTLVFIKTDDTWKITHEHFSHLKT